MILPDVNVLIYAFKTDDPLHRIAYAWLTDVVTGESRFALSTLALGAVVRITTDPRGHRNPASLADAFGFCNDLLAQPHCTMIEPGERHWDIFQTLCVETNTRGRAVTDAWFAALAIEWGCEWITFDRDFARFPGLKYTILSSRPD
ncbi:MAG: type II toxin-antitoxin system VapC family toxin [Xanthobacteraceae bacterium]